MYIFEVVTPGSRIAHENDEWAWKISGHIRFLTGEFFEANVALNQFIDANALLHEGIRRDTDISQEKWASNNARRQDIERTILAERGLQSIMGLHGGAYDEIRFESDVRLKRERWANGEMPRTLQNKLPFIAAKSFLYAFDSFEKMLDVLVKEEGVPPEVAAGHAKLLEAFPHLRGVRNSAHHQEDRIRGLRGQGKNKKPIDLKPIDNEAISAPEGAMIVGYFHNNRYSTTMEDGHLGTIEVSVESMVKLCEILHSILNSFKWSGPKQHEPF